MEYAIQTRGLTKRYGKRCALSGVDLNVLKGAIYGLIGRNGAGKTTLMKLITTLILPTKGTVSVKPGSRIGALIEEPALYPACTVRDNLIYKAIAMGLPHTEADRLIELVELQNAAQKKAKQLSLGMKQRLGIALALMGDPDILLLDEPINGMDPQGIAFVRTMLKTLHEQKGTTILLSSHVLDEMGKLATCVGIIGEGQLIEEMSMEELNERSRPTLFIRSPENERIVPLLKDRLGVSAQAEQGGLIIREGAEQHESVSRLLFDERIYVQEFAIKKPTLEEYFIAHTGGNGIA